MVRELAFLAGFGSLLNRISGLCRIKYRRLEEIKNQRMQKRGGGENQRCQTEGQNEY